MNVSEKKQKELAARMRALSLSDGDIEEKFVRSGGHGGQNVNKVATCVYLKHKATGIEVKCSIDREQAMNRFFARRMLVEKLEGVSLGMKAPKQAKIDKIRKNKKRRARRQRLKQEGGVTNE
jgi:protein subunit release factor B